MFFDSYLYWEAFPALLAEGHLEISFHHPKKLNTWCTYWLACNLAQNSFHMIFDLKKWFAYDPLGLDILSVISKPPHRAKQMSCSKDIEQKLLQGTLDAAIWFGKYSQFLIYWEQWLFGAGNDKINKAVESVILSSGINKVQAKWA